MRLLGATSQEFATRTAIVRIMIVSPSKIDPYNVILYGYINEYDESSFTCWAFEDVDSAVEYCCQRFGVVKDKLLEIPDQHHACREDWIAPVRSVTNSGNLGPWEILAEGQWVPLEHKHQSI